jgi:hypothetical protein
MSTKCWSCAYLASCYDYQKGSCNSFRTYRPSIKEVASLCNIPERTLQRWFSLKREEWVINEIRSRSGLNIGIGHNTEHKYFILKFKK